MTRMHSKSEAFRDILKIVGRGKKLQRDLTYDEAYKAMQLMLGEEVSDTQIGGFLLTMRVKEETAEEIHGFVDGARTHLKPMPQPNVEGLVDFGLPYNGKARTLQTGVISLMLVASVGVPVIVHGADDIPTKRGVGILNLLRALGYPADQTADVVSRTIEKTNFGVLNLEQVLPQWTALTPLRHHFGVRTLMNTVEKLLNPANAPRHINGFYHGIYLRRLATALPGKTANWVVQGEEGSIDIRLGKKSRVYQAVGEDMVETMINAEEYGFGEVVSIDFPNDAEYHAQTIRDMLNGEDHPLIPQVLLTAATMLWMLDAQPDIATALKIVQEKWDSDCVRTMLNMT
jgi:anthranilate phosphoribosyltransferase